MPTKQPASFDRKFVPLSTRFDHALLFASQVHREQDRKKSGIPYISHLLGVASIVLDYGGDEEMGIAALLHDAVEDHGGRPMLKVIDRIFGARVAKIVDGCTDSYVEDPKKKESWERRKFRYLRRVRHEDAETRFVSAADKLYNARAILDDYRKIGPQVWTRFKRGRKHQLWYFRELLKVFKAAGKNRIVAELERVTDKLERISANEKQKG